MTEGDHKSSYAKPPSFTTSCTKARRITRREATLLAELISEACPGAGRILDVACGTGLHAMHLWGQGFHVDGIDVEPAFLAAARDRCPDGTFRQADMTSFELRDEYDALICMFSAIGYVRDGGWAAKHTRADGAPRPPGRDRHHRTVVRARADVGPLRHDAHGRDPRT